MAKKSLSATDKRTLALAINGLLVYQDMVNDRIKKKDTYENISIAMMWFNKEMDIVSSLIGFDISTVTPKFIDSDTDKPYGE